MDERPAWNKDTISENLNTKKGKRPDRKQDLLFGTWNVKTLTNAGKQRNKTLKEMDRIVGNRKEWRSFAERNPTP